MPQLTMSRRKFAGVPVIMTTAAAPPPGVRSESRQLVALGWLSRTAGQVTVFGQLADRNSPPTGR
ncbi:hypothetical protein KDK95_14800 [Actinospica sp. MGRD01-02]|uniref:Uncharacterized protein n=1 Tax=Actinospica acidithermotolerans TaxID=2828514 RepID=A0A941E755_9ACTN|nr:hypothetical protein [Actinospica acidithermotolerans]MBR7827585.1 hypothetical protein [Actinospica acidithermotolerans]